MQTVLIVLDGWGIRPQREHNAIALARTPVFDAKMRKYLLEAARHDWSYASCARPA